MKSQIHPFFYNSRAGLCRTKSTPLPDILATRMRSFRPLSGGPGCHERNLCAHISTTIFIGCSRRPTWVQPSRRIRSRLHDIKLLGWTCLAGWDLGPPPLSVIQGTHMLVPSFWKHPLSEDCQHFRTPLSRAFRGLFAGLFLPWRPP